MADKGTKFGRCIAYRTDGYIEYYSKEDLPGVRFWLKSKSDKPEVDAAGFPVKAPDWSQQFRDRLPGATDQDLKDFLRAVDYVASGGYEKNSESHYSSGESVGYYIDGDPIPAVKSPAKSDIKITAGTSWGRWTWDGLALVGNFPNGKETRYIHVLHLAEDTRNWINRIAVRDDVEPADVNNFFRAMDALKEDGWLDVFNRSPKLVARLNEYEAKYAKQFGLTEEDIIKAREI